MATVPCGSSRSLLSLCFRGNLSVGFNRVLLSRQLTVLCNQSCNPNRNFSTARIEYDASSHDSLPRSGPRNGFGISFQEYVKYKSHVKTVKRISGIPFAVVGMGVNSLISVYMFPNMFDQAPELIEPIFGMDPLMFCGLSGVLCCGVGYIIGGTVSGLVWNFFNKDLAQKLQNRETDFLSRLSKHRFTSVSKFEDDYYGEKIKTLSDYRQWVRTQQKRRQDVDNYDKKMKEGGASANNKDMS